MTRKKAPELRTEYFLKPSSLYSEGITEYHILTRILHLDLRMPVPKHIRKGSNCKKISHYRGRGIAA